MDENGRRFLAAMQTVLLTLQFDGMPIEWKFRGQEISKDTLTQKSHTSKLGLLYLINVCQKFSKITAVRFNLVVSSSSAFPCMVYSDFRVSTI
jgi:hypothetical protein